MVGRREISLTVTDLESAFTDLSEADLNSYVKLKHLWDGTAIPAIARLNRGKEGPGHQNSTRLNKANGLTSLAREGTFLLGSDTPQKRG